MWLALEVHGDNLARAFQLAFGEPLRTTLPRPTCPADVTQEPCVRAMADGLKLSGDPCAVDEQVHFAIIDGLAQVDVGHELLVVDAGSVSDGLLDVRVRSHVFSTLCAWATGTQEGVLVTGAG